jgi:RNA polymerase sigma-70 factor (ECF subfamily)
MLGSLIESERLVEQTFSLASSQLKAQDVKDSVRVLLYRTIVNVCLAIPETQSRRTLPSLTYPPADPFEQPAASKSASIWLEPFPDELCPEITGERVAGYGAREMISLPFIAALQSIPPQERAIIILCDTMGWQPDQAGGVLGISNSEVNKMLGRARGVMARHYRAELGRREPPPPPNATTLLMQYLYTWETANLDGLMSRLTAGVTLQVPPSTSWYKGGAAVRQYLASHAFGSRSPDRWRLLPRRANGQLAFGTYERDDTGVEYAAHSIQVLTFEEDLVSEIIWFVNRSLFPAFKLRPRVIAQGRMAPRDDQG